MTLKSGLEGGWALLYPNQGASISTHDAAGGLLTITDHQGDEISACFYFEALGDDLQVEVLQGEVHALNQLP